MRGGTGQLGVHPRGTRHGFTATADARALMLVVPAGLEDFFAELGGGPGPTTPP